jgi:hypothetical protein
MGINLVIQSYGAENEYKRAVFTIWSFYAQSTIQFESTTVTLFTDNPEYFKPFLQSLPIRYVALTPDKLKRMRGEIDFVHRVKIAAIEEAFDISEQNVLYVDSDTFFISDPAIYIGQISSTQSFMHVNEYKFIDMMEFKLPAGKIFRDFYVFTQRNNFYLTDGSPIKIFPEQISWNAGVILLHRDHRKLLKEVYALTEAFYPETKNHGCEQYAFSVIMDHHTSLAPCEEMIYHYWNPIKKIIADKFFKNRINDKWSSLAPGAKRKSVKIWAQKLPSVFEHDVLMLRTRSMHAFQNENYGIGYYYALRSFKNPFSFKFIKNTLYYTKRFFFNRAIKP